MAEFVLKVKERTELGKGATRRARKEGYVPAEYYAPQEKNLHLLINAKELDSQISQMHGLVELEIEGKKKKVLCVLKDVQRSPVTEEIIHVDFQGVKRGKKLTVSVPVVLVGTAAGVKAGGILEHIIREVRVECMPKDIPEKIELDITNLNIGDALHVKDLKVENARILDDPEETILLIERSRAAMGAEAEEAAGEVEEEISEPEVITAKSQEEE